MAEAVDVARESIECFSAGDFDRLRSLLADDSHEEEYATQRHLEGADAQVDAARGWKEAFPDGRGIVTGACSDGKRVALEITWEGTQSGPMRTPDGQELPPTNRHGSVHACQVMESLALALRQDRWPCLEPPTSRRLSPPRPSYR